MEATSKLHRDDRFMDAYHGHVGLNSLTILPVTYTGNTVPTGFIVTHRLSAGPGMVQSEMTLNREQMAWLRDRLTDVLNETDPEYQAWIEELESGMKHNPDAPATVNPDQLKAYEAMVKPALPATDDEWKARLVEGGVA